VPETGESDPLGTVTLLRRYPVKSMLGEEVSAGDVTWAGLAQDRTLALIHRPTGQVVSAKNPRLWRDTLTLSAAAVGSAVRITGPDGKAVWSTDADIDDVLSQRLGQDVALTDAPPLDATLERAEPEEVLRSGVTAHVPLVLGRLAAASPKGTFFDYAPVHLLTTSTLDRISALSLRGTIEPERYRPNIVVRTTAAGFVENDWVGRNLLIGDDLVLRVLICTPRCAVPTLAHGDLARDNSALRVLADHNRVAPFETVGPQPCAGVYAQVLHPGRIHLGDRVHFSG
jgi:uncharacterized protein YcbX